MGNKWEQIACTLPGRTANDVKNYWNIKKRQEQRRAEIVHRYYPDESVYFEARRKKPPVPLPNRKPTRRTFITLKDNA